MPTWRRYFLHTRESTRTTWKLRIGVLIIVIVVGASTSGLWTGLLGRSLVCARGVARSDVILVENFDPNYLLFERAAALENAGLAPRILVLVQISFDGVNPVSKGIAEVMARQARIGAWEMIPIREVEPITLNAVAQIRERLRREHVKSLIVVTPGFRSRRSMLIYHAVLGDGGTRVHCDPVFGRTTPEHWTRTWHGIQEVAQEFLKLQYYRFYVIPFRSRHLADAVSDSGRDLRV